MKSEISCELPGMIKSNGVKRSHSTRLKFARGGCIALSWPLAFLSKQAQGRHVSYVR